MDEPEKGSYDTIIIAVPYHQFKEIGAEGLHSLGKENHVLYDIKYILPSEISGLHGCERATSVVNKSY